MSPYRSLVTRVCILTLGWLGISAGLVQAAEKPNVLFIAVDDLNDWVHHLGGHPQTITPHIDALAARGVTFYNAHCAAPSCNPSRAALMTGVRPATSGVYVNSTDWRPIINQVDSIPMHFAKHGYDTGGAGKIYHGGFDRDSDWHRYAHKKGKEAAPAPGHNDGVGGIRFAPTNLTDAEMGDYATVDWCIEQLNQRHDKPFFLACGLHKPHMAWNVPQKYYDMYPLDKIVLPKVLDTDLDDVPSSGVKMARPEGDHKAIIDSGRYKEAVQGYLAAITFADAMVGRMIAALDVSPHKNNTVIVLWGDHGWHLGEKLHWRKFSLWEEATRAPLIFVAPGVGQPGGVCRQPVDFMSIYPTLADLCGLPIPKHVEGPSLRPLLLDPSAAWPHVALTTWGRNNHAIRTDRWRYIRYANGEEELYDEQSDPQEWTNVAGRPEHAALKSQLAQHLPQVNKPEGGDKAQDAPAQPAKPKVKGKKQAKRAKKLIQPSTTAG